MIGFDNKQHSTEIAKIAEPQETLLRPDREKTMPWLKVWLCLILACIGASWFAYQYYLVPQTASFAPHWQDAQWIRATDGTAPVAYFRYATDIPTESNRAFVTIAADQTFRLYVNGMFIASNETDFTQGKGSLAYIYDITSALENGKNTIALRVANIDRRAPAVRVNIGIIQGTNVIYHGTDAQWQATEQSPLVYPQSTTSAIKWASPAFDASAWQPAALAASPTTTPLLQVNPLLYEQPVASQWITAGNAHDAYFVRSVGRTAGISGAWLRIAASGPAMIFINGYQYIMWDGQPLVSQQQINSYLSVQHTTYTPGNLWLGIYDITPYLHEGNNTLAIHVSAPGNGMDQFGFGTIGAALSADILLSDGTQQARWLPPDAGWRASPLATSGWQAGNNTASWSQPLPIARPGVSGVLYLPDQLTQRNVSNPPIVYTGLIVLLSTGAVLGLWLLAAFAIKKHCQRPYREVLAASCLACLPAVATEGLLVGLAQEPQLYHPFPYTWQWGLLLLALTAAGYLLVWWHMRTAPTAKSWHLFRKKAQPIHESALIVLQQPQHVSRWKSYRAEIIAGLRRHWPLVALMLIAIPLCCYKLTYENYWQDELTSYLAAKGILAHGIPVLPSGFLYAKAELYSYFLALSIVLFGEQQGRLAFVSIAEYLISLPVFYALAYSFCNRRIAVFATAILAFSPAALRWSHEVRMYEQAQLFTIITVYLFYRALQQPKRADRVYLALASLIATYLSHEETFIILPALIVAVLVASWRRKEGQQRLPAVLYEKHWWYATVLGICLIGLQLLIVKVAAPPILGSDQSRQPMIEITAENIPFYLKQFFVPSALGRPEPWITLNSLLALLGGIRAIRRGDRPMIYCTLFFTVALSTLILLFTLSSDRYIYPIMPIFYLLGAYALMHGVQELWSLAGKGQPSLPTNIMKGWTITLFCASVLIIPVLPISGYNLFASRVLGLSYHEHYADYDVAAQYLQEHWQPGDIVVAISPPISIRYYVGHLDYFFSVDRALYLFEQDNHITDTPTASVPLLSQQDFQAVLAAHARIWVVSDNGEYQAQTLKGGRFMLPDDFHVMFEGYGSAVYLRGG